MVKEKPQPFKEQWKELSKPKKFLISTTAVITTWCLVGGTSSAIKNREKYYGPSNDTVTTQVESEATRLERREEQELTKFFGHQIDAPPPPDNLMKLKARADANGYHEYEAFYIPREKVNATDTIPGQLRFL